MSKVFPVCVYPSIFQRIFHTFFTNSPFQSSIGIHESMLHPFIIHPLAHTHPRLSIYSFPINLSLFSSTYHSTSTSYHPSPPTHHYPPILTHPSSTTHHHPPILIHPSSATHYHPPSSPIHLHLLTHHHHPPLTTKQTPPIFHFPPSVILQHPTPITQPTPLFQKFRSHSKTHNIILLFIISEDPSELHATQHHVLQIECYFRTDQTK